jgi:hypothetical protein
MLDGELVIGYVFWEGKKEWNQVLETNTWPPDTETTTAWKVRNTGDQAAIFKVRFMDLESSGSLLNPGEEATFYLHPVTPSAGTYNYTLSVIADTRVVREYPIQVKTITGVSGLGLAIAAAGVLGLGILALGAYAMSRPREKAR